MRLTVVMALALACRAAAPAPAPAPSAGLPLVTPESLGLDNTRLDSVVTYLRTQVDSAFPGAVVAVGRHGRLALLAPVGHYAANDPRPVEPGTIYDLASLTKVIALTTVCILLVDQGKLDLDAPVQRYVPEFQGPMKDQVTIRHLLTHSGGLAADLPLWDSTRTRAAALRMVDTSPLLSPPGTQFVYSDLSAIVLMQVVERITGRPFDQVLAADVFTPLGMTATRFLPPQSWHDRIAPTEVDTFFRHRLLIGEVHDESAARLGGVSGNAGLFANAPDLARFASWLLAVRAGPLTPGHGPGVNPPWPDSALVRRFTTKQDMPPGSSRALGWDTPSGHSSGGSAPPPDAFGHTGYTGTSIWLYPSQDMFVILLTNRVNPTRTNIRILQVRPRVADLVFAAIR
ncbi:MAG TPA: serine hydrolase domain-containing protein [Gemmatimonadales bacterium]|nr:serine hydrolase domain-containing protein [Gemmatimonadales bacterium]